MGRVARAQGGRREEGMAGVRPPLVAAVTARLAPVAEAWLGIDPDQVVVSLHREPGGARGGRPPRNQRSPGWGSVELTGRGEQRRLMVSPPAGRPGPAWAARLPLTRPQLGRPRGRRGPPHPPPR